MLNNIEILYFVTKIGMCLTPKQALFNLICRTATSQTKLNLIILCHNNLGQNM